MNSIPFPPLSLKIFVLIVLPVFLILNACKKDDNSSGAGLDTLINPASKAHQTLYDNNTYIGWKPSTKTYIWHCRNDDCVPFGNFEKVKSVFGTMPNITYKEYPPINPIFNTIHETAAPIAFSEGTIWIMQQESLY